MFKKTPNDDRYNYNRYHLIKQFALLPRMTTPYNELINCAMENLKNLDNRLRHLWTFFFDHEFILQLYNKYKQSVIVLQALSILTNHSNDIQFYLYHAKCSIVEFRPYYEIKNGKFFFINFVNCENIRLVVFF